MEKQPDNTPFHFGALFRGTELERRRLRRQHLMRQVRNELDLEGEEMSAEDRQAHEEAMRRLRLIEEIFLREKSLGYWSTLWKALLGKFS